MSSSLLDCERYVSSQIFIHHRLHQQASVVLHYEHDQVHSISQSKPGLADIKSSAKIMNFELLLLKSAMQRVREIYHQVIRSTLRPAN